MKRLSNVSPFLLLLFPVFIMMVLAFVGNVSPAQDEELALKTNATPTATIIKATASILK